MEETVRVTDSEGKAIIGAVVTKGGDIYRKLYGPVGFTPTFVGVTDEKGEIHEWRRKH